MGKPMAINKVRLSKTHSGAPNMGNKNEKPSSKTHATTKYAKDALIT
jgi:hypothetical protein